MGLQRTIRHSSESSTVAFKIGMGHFHSQESGGCSYFLGELVLLGKQEGKLKGPCCGGPLEWVCLAAEKAAPLLLVILIDRVKDELAMLLEFP